MVANWGSPQLHCPLSPAFICLFQRWFWPQTSRSFLNNGEFFPLVALRGVWEIMLQLWLGWAWQWATSMGACCLFQKHGLYRAAKGQPSLCSRLDPEGLGLAAALLILGDPLTR